MKKITVALASIAMFISCSDKTADPVKEALIAEIGKTMKVEAPDVYFSNIARIDSTTFAEELDRRKVVLETKCKVLEKQALKYSAEGKLNASRNKVEELSATRNRLKDLEKLAQSLADIADKTAYYDYTFSATAKGDGRKMEFKEAYATVTPDFQVLGICSQKKDIHKGMGKVIPGYLEMLKGDSDEE